MFDDKRKDKAINTLLHQWWNMELIRHYAISLLAYMLYESTETILSDRRKCDWLMSMRYIDIGDVLENIRLEFFSRRIDEILLKNIIS